MRRFNFLKFLGIGAAAAVVAPLVPALPAPVLVHPDLSAVAYEITQMPLKPYGPTISTSTFFRAQTKVLERVYSKAPYHNDKPANFGTVFERG